MTSHGFCKYITSGVFPHKTILYYRTSKQLVGKFERMMIPDFSEKKPEKR